MSYECHITCSNLLMQEDRVKELTQKISETRQGVTEVKATIDTMRSTRDTYMSDMNQLKAAAREQNHRFAPDYVFTYCRVKF